MVIITTEFNDKYNNMIYFNDIVLYNNEKYKIIYDDNTDQISLMYLTDESIIIPLENIELKEIEILKKYDFVCYNKI